MVDLSDALVNVVADECLKCLESNSLPLLLNGGIPHTARIMEKNISLEVSHYNKFSAISRIKNFLTTVCASIFTDILQRVLATTSSAQTVPNQPLIIPGFPHPLFGGLAIVLRSMASDFPTGGLWGWDPNNNVS